MQDTFPTSTQGPGPVFWIVMCALIVLEIAAMWKVFEKAGQPGWAAIVPIYNLIVLIQIAGKPVWWILLYFIPIVSLIIAIIVLHNISVNFGKGVGFTLGLLFLSPIFFPILAWGDAEYRGPAGGSPVPA
ncbi:MAG TPA: DUF5684 domain-containing protein [Gemmatimonadales bacterium]|nr:DUF5684 domain-containing protein [Gemmatimonadales bacterium]